MSDHERIWLAPEEGHHDREWCQDNIWGDEGILYVKVGVLSELEASWKRLYGMVAKDWQERAEKAEAELIYYKDSVRKAEDQLDKLRAELAQARNAALEDAATMLETYEYGRPLLAGDDSRCVHWRDLTENCNECAAYVVRDLKTTTLETLMERERVCAIPGQTADSCPHFHELKCANGELRHCLVCGKRSFTPDEDY